MEIQLKNKTKYTSDPIDKDEICKDIDEDCVDVKCKVTCWLYAPENGICPYIK